MVKAYLGLGSNIGNRELQLNEAIKILHVSRYSSNSKFLIFMRLNQWDILISRNS